MKYNNVQNALVCGKNKKNFAITPNSPGKYCYFRGFEVFLQK